MDNENIMPLEEAYLIRKNQFQGIVTMPKEIKKRIILQDSQRQMHISLLKQALTNYRRIQKVNKNNLCM